MILTGVLLVLGFVTLGATLVQLNANEDKLTRTQRDPLMETVDELIAGFSTAMRGAVDLGTTNITLFADLSKAQEGTLNDAAGRVGLYANATLVPNPDLATFLDETKCVGYDAFRSKDGVIIGFEKHTLQETIVGAVYRMDFTDGRQKITMDHYVKIFDCTPQHLYTFPIAVSENHGDATAITPLKDPKDDRANTTLREILAGSQTHHQHANVKVKTLQVLGWNSPTNIESQDTNQATRPSPNIVDRLPFTFTPTPLMDEVKDHWGDVTVNNLTMNVTMRSQVGWLSSSSDYLRLEAYKPGVSLIPYWTHNFTGDYKPTSSWQTFSLSPKSPSGDGNWTYDEFNNVTFQFRLVVVGLKDTDHTFHIQYVGGDIEFKGPLGYRMDIEFDWEVSPRLLGEEGIYGNHTLQMRYRIPGASNEVFRVQMWNGTVWKNVGDALMPNDLDPNTPEWNDDWAYEIAPEFYDSIANGADKRFVRIVDTVLNDLSKGERDRIYIDYFGMRSTFIGAPP